MLFTAPATVACALLASIGHALASESSSKPLTFDDICKTGSEKCGLDLLQQGFQKRRQQRAQPAVEEKPFTPAWLDEALEDIVATYYHNAAWVGHWRQHVRNWPAFNWGVELRNCSTSPKSCMEPFNCSRDPAMCEEPYNCQRAPKTALEFWAIASSTKFPEMGKDELGISKPALQFACYFDPYFWSWLKLVNAGDKIAGAHARYQVSMEGEWLPGPGRRQTEASECFIEGHCLNTAVTNLTTDEEGQKMCLERYGDYIGGQVALLDSDLLAVASDIHGIALKSAARVAHAFGQNSCVLKEYPGFVVYCQETHCKDKEMIEKYGRLQDDFGWTKPGPKTDVWWFRGQGSGPPNASKLSNKWPKSLVALASSWDISTSCRPAAEIAGCASFILGHMTGEPDDDECRRVEAYTSCLESAGCCEDVSSADGETHILTFTLLYRPFCPNVELTEKCVARSNVSAQTALPKKKTQTYYASLDASKMRRLRPWAMEEPFHCQDVDPKQQLSWTTGLATSGGKGDPSVICGGATSDHVDVIDMYHSCYMGKHLESARIWREIKGMDLWMGPEIELSASMCFSSGSCIHDKTTADSTRDDSDEFCNERYGNANWTLEGFDWHGVQSSHGSTMPGPLLDRTDHWAKFWCATGAFHCFVMMCKVDFCKDPSSQKTFASLTPRDPYKPTDRQEKSADFFNQNWFGDT